MFEFHFDIPNILFLFLIFTRDFSKILGILLGLVWGLLPLKGFLGLVLFAGISAGIVYVWITAIQVSLHSQEWGF